MKTTFDFMNTNSNYSFMVNPDIQTADTIYSQSVVLAQSSSKTPQNIQLNLDRTSHSVAVLYFTDNQSNKINIPKEITVYTYDYQNIKKRVILEPINQYYALCWTDNYVVELNNKILLEIKNKRSWDIIVTDF